MSTVGVTDHLQESRAEVWADEQGRASGMCGVLVHCVCVEFAGVRGGKWGVCDLMYVFMSLDPLKYDKCVDVNARKKYGFL